MPVFLLGRVRSFKNGDFGGRTGGLSGFDSGCGPGEQVRCWLNGQTCLSHGEKPGSAHSGRVPFSEHPSLNELIMSCLIRSVIH